MFKLSKGAASANVRLVRTAKQAKRLLKRAFGQGFIPVATVGNLFEKPGALFTHVRRKGNLHMFVSLTRLPKWIMEIHRQQMLAGREKGYLYLQEFIAGNQFDTRITIIGKRAFGFTRNVRASDFRIETLDFSWVTGDGGWVNIVQLTTVWKASAGVFATLGYKRDEETL